MITRRNLLTGMAAFIAAPAIIRVADLMPVKAWSEPLFTILSVTPDGVWRGAPGGGNQFLPWDEVFPNAKIGQVYASLRMT